MKVILQQDVAGIGKAGDIIEVKEGYARNFLFPKKLAEIASESSLNAMKQKAAALNHKKELEKKAMQALAAKIEGKNFVIKVKMGESGKLFGSVGTKEIADAMLESGFEVDKKKIVLSEPIKEVGQTQVEVKLFAEVHASIYVTVAEA